MREQSRAVWLLGWPSLGPGVAGQEGEEQPMGLQWKLQKQKQLSSEEAWSQPEAEAWAQLMK